MAVATRTSRNQLETKGLVDLMNALQQERLRLDRLMVRVESALRGQSSAQSGHLPPATTQPSTLAARPSPLDKFKSVRDVTRDLRLSNGNLSADRVAKVFGVSISQLAKWMGRTRQSVSKTPDAESLQEALGYFERIARLRQVTRDASEFRKWLRAPQASVAGENPMELLRRGEWQALADLVDDILTGTPG